MNGSFQGRLPPTSAIVLGLSATGFGVVRSLARLGVEIHGVYSDRAAETARHSRMLRARYRLSDPTSDDQVMHVLERIRRVAGVPDRMVLIPTSDTYARFVSAHRAALEADFLFRVPPPALATTFLDKRAAAGICRQYGIPIPPTCVPEVIEDVESDARRFRYPVIIKPAGAHVKGFPGKNVIADNADELLAFYTEHSTLVRETVYQELVDSGDGHILYVSTYSGAEGTVIARCSFRKLRQWLPDRGVTAYGVSESLPKLLDLTTTFLNDIGYVGFTGVEFAEDASTGEIFFLELNARPVLPNQLFADAGIDLTAVSYLEMCGEATPRGLIQRDGVYWIDIHFDIPSAIVRWSRGELGLGEWIRDAWRATSIASWDRQDPKPFVASLARMASVGMGLTHDRQVGSIRSIRSLRRAR